MSQPRLPATGPLGRPPRVWWRWHRRLAVLGVLAALGPVAGLTGCTPPPQPSPKLAKPIPLVPARRPAAKVAVARPQPLASGPPVIRDPVETQPLLAVPEPMPEPVPEPAPETAPETAPAPPPSAAAGPATLVGLSQGDVRGLLGDPAAAGAAGPGQTWTYRSADCSLTVAFFYDVTRGAFFALSAHAEPLPEPDCLARLRAATHGT